jgi:hypothetical protein
MGFPIRKIKRKIYVKKYPCQNKKEQFVVKNPPRDKKQENLFLKKPLSFSFSEKKRKKC